MANVYDFDETIFKGDTVFLFFNYCSKLDNLPINTINTIKELLKLPTDLFFDTVDYFFTLFKDVDNLNEIISDFWDKHQNRVKPFYYEIKKEDDVISSASPLFLIEPIMKKLNIKNYICTELDDNYWIKYFNKGKFKVESLYARYPNIVIDNFYSDSDTDFPLAELAKKAYKVNGNEITIWDTSKKPLNIKKEDYISYIDMKGDELKILNLTDIQLSNDDFSNGLAVDTFNQIKELVIKTNPDLITLTGDQVYNGALSSLKSICEFIDSFNIPWAPIFGNHDHIQRFGFINRSEKVQGYIYMQYKNCLYKQGPNNLAYYITNKEIFGNYIICIRKDNEVIRNLIMLNSGDMLNYSNEEMNDSLHAHETPYAKLSDEQVSLINEFSNDVPSSLFIHIPLFIYGPAFCEIVDTKSSYFSDRSAFVSEINKENKLPIKESNDCHYIDGVFKDSAVCSSPIDDHVFERICDSKLDSVISGHDHTNSFILDYKNIILAYGLKTGKGCYYNKSLQGGTLITIKKDIKPTFKHIYIRE